MFPEYGPSSPLAPPFVPSSVFALPDLDALEAISTGQVPGFIYARDNHPNGVQLEAELAQLEKAAGAIVCSNGMAAIATVALATLQQGSRVLASDQLYGRTTQLFFQELPRWGIEISAVDTTNLVAVEQALAAGPVSLFLVETLSNPLLAVAPLRELIALAEKYHTEILVDNTFASPALCRPTELGADYTMESLTKIIGGHSDITLGAVVVKDVARLARLRQVRSIWGWMGDSFPCWLSLRGLPTLPLRMEASCENANRLARFLKDQSGVAQVLHPSLPDHPDHTLAQKLFEGRFGNMLCFEIEGGRAAVNLFFQRASKLKFCPSLGDYATTCSHPASTSHRYLDPAERERLGIRQGHIRVSVGIEPWPELQAAFLEGLQ